MSPHNMPGLAETVPRGIALLTYHGARYGIAPFVCLSW